MTTNYWGGEWKDYLRLKRKISLARGDREENSSQVSGYTGGLGKQTPQNQQSDTSDSQKIPVIVAESQ